MCNRSVCGRVFFLFDNLKGKEIVLRVVCERVVFDDDRKVLYEVLCEVRNSLDSSILFLFSFLFVYGFISVFVDDLVVFVLLVFFLLDLLKRFLLFNIGYVKLVL